MSVAAGGVIPVRPAESCRPTFGVLGALRIRRADEEVVLPSSKPTVLLGALLLHPNEIVSQEYLRSALWGDDAPAAASSAVHVAVLRLRKLLGRHGLGSGPDGGIETCPGGYRITVEEPGLDLLAFRSLVRDAEHASSPRSELATLSRALEYWEGDPVANLDSPVLRSGVVASLVEERIRILARCHDIELALGNCARIIPGLRHLFVEFPDNERLAAQLMEALYRTGRQGEALSVHQQISHRLRETFGVDPGHELQRLHLAIVRGEELAAVRSVPAAAVRPARAGLPARDPGGPAWTALPVRPADFTGRTRETEEIESILDQGPGRIIVLCGLPGVGKTALAAHLARRLRDRFPDGPVRFLRADGDTPFPAPPPGTDDRSFTVLDGVRHADQVRDFLDTGCFGAAVITSRHSLAGLALSHGAALYRIGPWQRADSLHFLTSVLGTERAAAEEGRLNRLAEACDDHPMALRLASMRISLRPLQNLLEAVRGGAVAGHFGDPLSAAFDDYVARLPGRIPAAVRVLAASPAEGFSVPESAALLGEAEAAAAALLDELVGFCTVEHLTGGRYRIPRILRAHLNRSENQEN